MKNSKEKKCCTLLKVIGIILICLTVVAALVFGLYKAVTYQWQDEPREYSVTNQYITKLGETKVLAHRAGKRLFPQGTMMAFEGCVNAEDFDTDFFEFDVKEIIKADVKSRYEVYRMSKECQMTTINERRRMENMNDIEGGDVIDLGLGAVLFDVNTQTYYTPNTNETSSGGADVKTLEEESFIDKIKFLYGILVTDTDDEEDNSTS